MTGHGDAPSPATPSGSGGLDVTLLPVGDEGLLLELADLDDVLLLDAAVRAAVEEAGAAAVEAPSGVAVEEAADPAFEGGTSPWSDVTDVVPAARTVLLLTREGADLTALRRAVVELTSSTHPTADPDVVQRIGDLQGDPVSGTAPRSHEVEIVVRYDGPDLHAVAALTGLTSAEVVAAHTGTPWRVAFGGFAPGFAYLVGGDPRLQVPRHERPRPSVPAGSVGLAGEFSGVYPRSSPGGWQLLGTTDAVLWDTAREPPALLRPGTRVRFVDAAAAT